MSLQVPSAASLANSGTITTLGSRSRLFVFVGGLQAVPSVTLILVGAVTREPRWLWHEDPAVFGDHGVAVC